MFFIILFVRDRFVQNLVFYGVSQNTGTEKPIFAWLKYTMRNASLGTWLVNPYVSFAASALVEIMAYLVVHLTLDRRGRKLTYSAFVMGFVIVAFLVVPIQMLMIKNSRGTSERTDWLVALLLFRTIHSDVHRPCGTEVFRFGFICNHLHLCQWIVPHSRTEYWHRYLFDGCSTGSNRWNIIQWCSSKNVVLHIFGNHLNNSSRHAFGSISPSSCLVSRLYWLWLRSRSVPRQPASLCLRQSMMSNAWV